VIEIPEVSSASELEGLQQLFLGGGIEHAHRCG
jgi:hypothetical protein